MGAMPRGSVYPTPAKINAKNASKPKPAWKFGIDPGGVNPEAATRFVSSTEAVPIMVGGSLYLYRKGALWSLARELL